MRGLPTSGVGQPLMVWLDDVASTNSYAIAHLSSLRHGTFVIAEHQQAGMGRLGRRWHSPPGGNVYMTGVVKSPPFAAAQGAWGGLTLVMALAVCDALDAHHLSPTLKWPNDVEVGGNKIAGILAQAVSVADRVMGSAVGVGINVNMTPDELQQIGRPATSLFVLLGRRLDAHAIAYAVAVRFLDRLSGYDAPTVRSEAWARSRCVGHPVTVTTPGGTVSGRAVGLDDAFRLVIQDERGVRQAVQAGDVRC